MAFEGLSSRLQEITRKLKGKARITESDLKEMLREVKLALLEADVNYKIVKEFIANIQEKALGQDVLKSLTPGQQVIKIVKDELVELLGGTESKVNFSPNPPTIIMMVGLQGSGKTTTSGKLANLFRKQGKKPLLVACDVYRPAAIEQLKQIGKELNIEVYEEGKNNPRDIAVNAIKYAKDNNYDYVLIDTAGRLHIDSELMQELNDIKTLVQPHEILLVVDSMIGQDAINVIEGFNNNLNLTGAILTKLDGDTKGGVALSVRQLTNVPIKFVGVSEKMDGLEEFDPERIANRILDMGDLLGMIEKAENLIDEDMLKTAKKMQSGKFDLEDFLCQLNQIKKLGPLENIIKMLPNAKKMGLGNVTINPKDMAHVEAIILSMTPYERRHPEVLKASRKIRIAKGSGRSVEEVNRLLKQFEQMKTLMKQFKNGKMPF